MRPYVESRPVPGDAYRRPAMLCGHCLLVTLDTQAKAHLWRRIDEAWRNVEVQKLIAEQAAEMAAEKGNAAQLELDGANEGSKEEPTNGQ